MFGAELKVSPNAGQFLAASAVIAVFAAAAHAQAKPLPDLGPRVGETAPDFTVTGATRYGILRSRIRLSDFRGKTVVLAFFYQARTKG